MTNRLFAYAERDLIPELQDREALRRMRLCRWNYTFDTYLAGTLWEANYYAKKLIWC